MPPHCDNGSERNSEQCKTDGQNHAIKASQIPYQRHPSYIEGKQHLNWVRNDPPGEPRALRVNKVAEVLETASVFSAQCIGATLSTHANL